MKSIAEAAVAAENPRCPAELLLAQCAIESGWLKKSLPGWNCFGMKSAHPGGREALSATSEWFTEAEARHFLEAREGRSAHLVRGVSAKPNGRCLYACRDWFMVFDSLADAFRVRAGGFTGGRYAPHVIAYQKDRDLERFIRGIGPIFATDPRYSESVLSIIRMPQVKAAIAAARSKS
jgi:flagellum-specific peptidoglycan hydrolase FlgJ